MTYSSNSVSVTNVPFALYANNASINVPTPNQITTSNTTSGNGLMGSPYSSNSTTNAAKFTLPYTNTSSYNMSQFIIDTSSLPAGVMVDPSSTCPTTTGNPNTTTLAPNTSCQLILTINQDYLATTSQSTISLDVAYPTATFQNVNGTNTLSPNQTLYLSYTQAMLVTTVSPDNDNSSAVRTLSMAITNSAPGNITTATTTAASSGLLSSINNIGANCNLSGNIVSCTFDGSISSTSVASYNINTSLVNSGEAGDFGIEIAASLAPGKISTSPTFLNIRYSPALPQWQELGGTGAFQSAIGGGNAFGNTANQTAIKSDGNGNLYIVSNKGTTTNGTFVARYNSGTGIWSNTNLSLTDFTVSNNQILTSAMVGNSLYLFYNYDNLGTANAAGKIYDGSSWTDMTSLATTNIMNNPTAYSAYSSVNNLLAISYLVSGPVSTYDGTTWSTLGTTGLASVNGG